MWSCRWLMGGDAAVRSARPERLPTAGAPEAFALEIPELFGPV